MFMKGTLILSNKAWRWTQNYLKLAQHISSWSKDPGTKVGAVAVGKQGQILSQGYNGFPRGVKDSEDRLHEREVKYKFVVHAEQNCIYNATLNGVGLDNADLYVYGLPVCSECAKGVIQVGIKRVFICHPTEIAPIWQDAYKFTKLMFEEAGVSAARFDYHTGELLDVIGPDRW
jgi:dCMP deaminase